jgi:hypothetical protein
MQFRNATTHAAVVAAILLSAASGVAQAVTLSPRGTGQVLLYPFYTVNGGNDTLLSIANTTAHAKVLRVRMAEGENGRDAYSLNLYLAPFDTWSAVLTSARLTVPGIASPVAGLRSSDLSCTVPAIATGNQLVGGGVALNNDAFFGANADPGGTASARVNEGSVEVIEMGTLVDGSPSALAAMHPGQTPGCATLANAWAADGYWAQHPDTDLANPTGGVYGTAYVINVTQGTIFSYGATAIDGFRTDPSDLPVGSTSSVVLHTKPASARPNLGDALSDPAARTVVAHVDADGRQITATYPAPARAIDAVSAVLMAGRIDSEFLADTSLGATTSYVFNYPTRRFYTDPAIVGTAAIAPFSTLFGGIRVDTVSEVIPYSDFDRDGKSPIISCGVDLCANRLKTPGTSVEVLNIGTGANAILGSALTMGFVPPRSSVGRVQFAPDLSIVAGIWSGNGLPPRRYLRASNEGKNLAGIPVIGFSTLNLINANAQNGVLANYSAAVPFRTTTACYAVGAGDIAVACN